MPVLSKFYGVVIRMLFVRKFAPQFTAIYGNEEMIVGIRPVSIIRGDLPPEAQALVIRWAAQHQHELMAAWQSCEARQAPVAIAPLALAA